MKQKLKKYIAYTRDETTRCRRADFAPIALHAAYIAPPAAARYHPHRDTTGIKGIPLPLKTTV